MKAVLQVQAQVAALVLVVVAAKSAHAQHAMTAAQPALTLAVRKSLGLWISKPRLQSLSSIWCVWCFVSRDSWYLLTWSTRHVVAAFGQEAPENRRAIVSTTGGTHQRIQCQHVLQGT